MHSAVIFGVSCPQRRPDSLTRSFGQFPCHASVLVLGLMLRHPSTAVAGSIILSRPHQLLAAALSFFCSGCVRAWVCMLVCGSGCV
jgi:hypothetical protein